MRRGCSKGDLQSYRIRDWLTLGDDEQFAGKVADLCAVYREAPESAARGERTGNSDELTEA